MDLEDFIKDRGIDEEPVEDAPSKKRQKADKPKKKIKLGFGKKNKVDDVDLEE